MKKLRKQLMSVLLVLALLSPQSAVRAETTETTASSANGFVIEDNVLTKYTGTSAIVHVPEGVAEIGKQAFRLNNTLECVHLPDSLKYIDREAFSACNNLIEINFPDNLLRIGKHAFYQAQSLQEADLSGTKIEAISNNTFEGCKELFSVSMPNSVKRIGDDAFQYCSNLSNLSLSENVQFIGDHAFAGCAFQHINLPDSLRWIGEYAFSDCENLQKLTIPKGITILPEGALRNTFELKELTLPDTLQIIDNNVLFMNPSQFDWTSPMKELTIPASVVSIGKSEKTFDHTGLEKVTVTEGSEGDRYFTDFENGNGILVEKNIQKAAAGSENYLPEIPSPEIGENQAALLYGNKRSDYMIQDGVLLQYRGSDSTVIVPDGVTEIGKQAFNNNENIVTVILPESVTKIGNSAFYGCDSLMYVSLPESVTEIETQAFASCTSLMALSLPAGVTEIADKMCNGCTSLMKVDIGSAVTAIGKNAFEKAPMPTVSLPASLQSIGEHAFAYCGLREIILPNSISAISGYAFYECQYLTSVSWPAQVTELPERVFENCGHLRNVYLHDGLTSIANRAFNGCDMLTELYIPKTVTSIGANIFNNSNQKLNMEKICGEKGTEAAGLAETVGCSFYVLTDAQISEYEARNTTKMPQRKLESSGTESGGTVVEPPSPENYTGITSAAGLEAVRNHLDGNYRLDVDLDLSGSEWIPIGVDDSRTTPFTGIFDGNGHSITGLTMNTTKQKTRVANGLFAIVNGTVKNLTLKDCSITIANSGSPSDTTSGFTYGGIAGAIGYDMEDDSAGIENCRVTGNVIYYGDNGSEDSGSLVSDEDLKMKDLSDDELSVGGIAGQMLHGKITDCINEATVAYASKKVEDTLDPEEYAIGGICGYKQSGNILHCVNRGTISLARAAFGHFGSKKDATSTDDIILEIVNSIMGRGDVNLYNYAGGICGYIRGTGEISGCYNKGAVSNKMYYKTKATLIQHRAYTEAGGICGYLGGTKIANCYNTGAINSDCDIDNVISIIEDSRFDVDVPFTNDHSYAGGIAGRTSRGLLAYCFNLGSVGIGEGTGAYAAIATGDGPLRYCRYLEGENLKGCTRYEDARSRCMPMTKESTQESGVMTTDPDTYRNFDFGATWILESGMEYPQLLDNMESAVTNFTWKSSALKKTDYNYGESLDTTGLEAAFSLSGVNGQIIYRVAPERINGYEIWTPGRQSLNLNLFGNPLSLTVTVGEKPAAETEDTHEHQYYSTNYNATCTEAQKTVKQCYYCDDQAEETKGTALGHNYRKEIQENGTIKYVCSRCGEMTDDPSATITPGSSAAPEDPKASADPDKPGSSAPPENPKASADPDKPGSSAPPEDPKASADPDKPGNSAIPGGQKEPTSGKKAQTVSCTTFYKKAYGSKPFKLNVKLTQGDGILSYTSSNIAVAVVDKTGTVTLKGMGVCTLTVSASATKNCNAVSTKVTLQVVPKKATLKSLKAVKGKKLKVKWKKNTAATGYEIQYATKKNFAKAKKVTVKKSKTNAIVLKKLKKGKKYYVRIRSYKLSGKTKLYGGYSKIRTAKVKK